MIYRQTMTVDMKKATTYTEGSLFSYITLYY